MQAEDLHVAPVITWWNNRTCGPISELPARTARRVRRQPLSTTCMAGEDEREGGRLAVLPPAAAAGDHRATREYPVADEVRRGGPASDQASGSTSRSPSGGTCRSGWRAARSIRSASPTTTCAADTMYETEAWGKPRDRRAPARPAGQRLLVAGDLLSRAQLRPADAAVGRQRLGRAAQPGRLQPRVRATSAGVRRYENWWDGLKAGRSFVTNGPLLRGHGRRPVSGARLPRRPGEHDRNSSVSEAHDVRRRGRNRDRPRWSRRPHGTRHASPHDGKPELNRVRSQRLVSGAGHCQGTSHVSVRVVGPVLCRDRGRKESA